MYQLMYRKTKGDHARSEVCWHCTGTCCKGSASSLPIYATAAGSLHGLSAAGKSGDDVDIYGLYTERKKEVGKMVDKHMQKKIISMEKRIADLEKKVQGQQRDVISSNPYECVKQTFTKLFLRK